MRRPVSLVLALGLTLLAGGGTHAAGQPVATTASADAPRVTKLLVVVEENHSLSQMKSGMPYTFSLAQRYGYATDYHALRHPSLPNYLAITGGRMYGVRDDAGPASHQITGRSVFGQARVHGKTAAAYAESQPARCSLSNSGEYLVRHNPWTYFTHERTGCRAHDHTMKAFGSAVADGRLPRVGMVTPNKCNDAHDCRLSTADAWFKNLMTKVFAGPDWKSGRLAVVLTADEDDHGNEGNVVLTSLIHPSQNHRVVTTRLTHYSLTRLYDEVAGLPLLCHAQDAPSMARAFHLPVGG